MTSTGRFGPWREELSQIRDQVKGVLEDTFSFSGLPVDIYETADSVVIVTGAIVGLKTDSLDISITEGHQVTIEGETVAPEDVAGARYLRRERKFGNFSKTVAIPMAVVAEEAKASYKNNILTITIPKKEQKGPRVVKVTPVE
jgi:HSP20 family protein